MKESTQYLLYIRDTSTNIVYQSWLSSSTTNCASGSGVCSYKPNITMLPKNYNWWIKTKNSAGEEPWSSTMLFTVK